MYQSLIEEILSLPEGLETIECWQKHEVMALCMTKNVRSQKTEQRSILQIIRISKSQSLCCCIPEMIHCILVNLCLKKISN